jgi:predicted dienelactone hydrolase
MTGTAYDPFARGPFAAGVRTLDAFDAARARVFPLELWYPARGDTGTPELRDAPPLDGTLPLVAFSHASGGGRRGSSFLCTHLASHGYVVAALEHSEAIAPELARTADETPERRAARIEGWIANRVPDVRFVLDHLLAVADLGRNTTLDATRIGLAGMSFGGWTALAAAGEDARVRSVVALAPAGSTQRMPGMIPAELHFEGRRAVPALYIVAENDASLPLRGMEELYARAPAPKRIVVLRRADHMHFMDDTETRHEATRTATFPGELAWLPAAMRPIGELVSGEEAHAAVRGLATAHFDATLRDRAEACALLAGDLDAALARRGFAAYSPRE